MNLSFLFPGSGPHEALDGWVKALARHSRRHAVSLARCAGDCLSADAVFVLTEGRTFPRPRCDQALAALRVSKKPFAVLHNHDNPPVPTPGGYPSFCWTERQRRRLRVYDPQMVRMPVFPAVVPYEEPPHDRPVAALVGTFGVVEPKKCVLEMVSWARENDVPFRVYGPERMAAPYEDYLRVLHRRGADVVLYPWAEKVEDLAPLFAPVSHWLFVLPESKGGTGGSPTSPRYAGFFNRPVFVVDDEGTYTEDGYLVYYGLDGINRHALLNQRPPCYDWGVDEYLDALARPTLAYWGQR